MPGRPLGNVGLGEPLVFLFMGPVMVLGSFYVQVQMLSRAAVWLSVPVGCLVTAILVANNLRDVEEDRHSGKRTLVALWGHQGVAWLFWLLLLVAFGMLPILALHGVVPWVGLFPFLLVLPQSWRLTPGVAPDRTLCSTRIMTDSIALRLIADTRCQPRTGLVAIVPRMPQVRNTAPGVPWQRHAHTDWRSTVSRSR